MNITIGKKLMGGFSSIVILLGIISCKSYYNLQKADDSYSDLVDRRAVILSNVKDINNLVESEKCITKRSSEGNIKMKISSENQK